MKLSQPLARELTLAVTFAVACLVGFLADLLAFKVALALGLGSSPARFIALGVAIQVSFVHSRWVVFRAGDHASLTREWARYMVANGLGALCNFWMFVTLVALKWPVISDRWVALVAASSAAYAINYAGTRLFVFGRGRTIKV